MNIYNFLFLIILTIFNTITCSPYAKTLPDMDSPPAKFILNISDKIHAVNASNLKNEQKLFQLKDIIVEFVDIERITNFVLGRNIKNVSDSDKLIFKKAYKDYLVKKYSKLLSSYEGKINISGIKALSKNMFSVSTAVEDKNGNKISVSYSLIKNDKDSFMIYDILLADGMSLSISDRDEVSRFVEINGLDKLLQNLKEESAVN